MSAPLFKLGPVRIVPSKDGTTRIVWRPYVAGSLRRLAHWIYPEPLSTLTVATNEGERTFIDCREVEPR